jgi:long-chain acyl-CoA synthetase
MFARRWGIQLWEVERAMATQTKARSDPLGPSNNSGGHEATGKLPLDEQQQRWLAPPPFPLRMVRDIGFLLNRRVMRTVLRVRPIHAQRLPQQGPFILAPNHTSSLDPAAIAATLDLAVFRRTRWIARRQAVFKSPIRHIFCRLGQAFPIQQDGSAIKAAVTILNHGENVVWFPEGHRTTDGHLQPFHRGIGLLVEQAQVRVVPVRLMGAFESLPPDRRWPVRYGPIYVVFGCPVLPQQVKQLHGKDPHQQFADLLHDRVAELKAPVERRFGR